ncbi:MAG: uracil phosphoribosyltransferase [Clostridiales bacterium]|nr:uracil phosphoribosyltransferase [Clostridiales bacterium]
MGTLHVMDHPLVQHKLSLMRNKDTGIKEFRELLDEISMLLTYEATRDLPLEDVEVETPICTCKTKMLSGRKLGIIPILRAGLGMVDGILRLVPAAKVGHIGLYRDPETLQPVEYYCKLPVDAPERHLIVLDPMLATGGSSSAAIDFLKRRGCSNIKLVCLLGAPEGIKYVMDHHPDVDIYIAAVDSHLNEHGYIVPGLGDAGDRLFGTK